MVSSRAGQAEADVVVFVRALAVDADAAQRLGQFGIVGEDRAAVAEAAERLGRERSWSRSQGRRCRAAGPCSSRRNPCAASSSTNMPSASATAAMRVMVGALPEQIDRNDGPRLEAGAASRSRCRASAKLASMLNVASSTSTNTGVAPVSATASPVAQNVKDGQSTASPAADALRHQHHQQRVGAAGAGHDMPGAAESREIGLELRPLPGR